MDTRAFEVGDRVRVVQSSFGGPTSIGGAIGVVRSVDKNRRRTEPYFIYYVELPGEDALVDFEYRELESVTPVADEFKLKDL